MQIVLRFYESNVIEGINNTTIPNFDVTVRWLFMVRQEVASLVMSFLALIYTMTEALLSASVADYIISTYCSFRFSCSVLLRHEKAKHIRIEMGNSPEEKNNRGFEKKVQRMAGYGKPLVLSILPQPMVQVQKGLIISNNNIDNRLQGQQLL
ncbi:MAG: hypothetical protein IPI42_16495 [Saprospiraceae bacterium]|nr:hypothetical protein [Candidatus Parvibacillus calidus]